MTIWTTLAPSCRALALAHGLDPVWLSGIVLVLVALEIAEVTLHFIRARRALKRWAAAYGCRILERRWRPLRRGPFFLRAGRGQVVYRIVAEDATGHVRSGYARCGGFFLGLRSSDVSVRWDPDPDPHGPPGFEVILPNDSPPR